MSHQHEDAQPVVLAQQKTLAFNPPISEPELRKKTDSFLSAFTRSLAKQGCELIGHVKGLLDAGGAGRLFFSVTSFEQAPRYKGGLSDVVSKVTLEINVIVYGVETAGVQKAVLEGWAHLREDG